MNILLTSVGRRSYLVKYFQTALNGDGKVHVANSSDISPAFQVADKAVVTPLIYNGNYIPFLKKYCVENNISAIISLFDIDLLILAKHKQEFEKIGVTVIVSDYSIVEICNDKWKTYQFLVTHGFNTPKTYLLVNEALNAVKNGDISYPIMIKPRWGMGSISVFEAENEEELMVLYKKAKRNIERTYLKYESVKDIERSILIQEKLCGQEYGLDVINDLQGNYINTSSKMKYAMRSGETDCAITVNEPELKTIGYKLSKYLHHIANLDTDIFKVNDKYYVLEMNARFGGGYPFSHLAGVNLSLAIVKWLNGETVDKSLLTERVNIMVQKDINLVRLYHSSDIEIKKITKQYKIINLITEFEKYLTPSLTERKIDVKAYAKKISKFGQMYGAYNSKGECCGVLAVYINDMKTQKAYLTILAVKSEYRSLNIGKNLLSIAEVKAKQQGMRELILEVRKKNCNAIEFYQAQGYNLSDKISNESYHMKKVF